MRIGGLQKLTLLDFPEHVACTVFTLGCNFRCPFCHNSALVLEDKVRQAETISEEEFFKFLNKRKGLLDGVAITGGEPLIQPDIKGFIRKIRDLGFLVKLDTNGSFPKQLKEILDEGLVDYVAMDIKSSKEGYPLASGIKNIDISAIEESVNILMSSSIEYEFRTTVMKELHTEKEFRSIAEWIKGCRAYYLQSYRHSETILSHMMDDEFQSLYPKEFTPYKNEELKEICDLLISLGVNASLRGIA